MSNFQRDPEPPNPVEPIYLRVGDWNPDDPRSRNYATGDIEMGLSVYDLDCNGNPLVPPDGEWAAEDLADRLASALPKHLVQGRHIGIGHDGEPLLDHIRIVGRWPEDRHLVARASVEDEPDAGVPSGPGRR